MHLMRCARYALKINQPTPRSGRRLTMIRHGTHPNAPMLSRLRYHLRNRHSGRSRLIGLPIFLSMTLPRSANLRRKFFQPSSRETLRFSDYFATFSASSNLTESNFDTPSCPMVTPYSSPAALMVARLCVMTISCDFAPSSFIMSA